MKKNVTEIIRSYRRIKYDQKRLEQMAAIHRKNAAFTMISEELYVDNLLLAEKIKLVDGDIVECGVWRGGMIAGIAELIGKGRNYFLFDSFEGLPEAKEIDGKSAIAWQQNKEGENYHDNCKAEMDFAITAMEKTGVDYECIKGWFDETVPVFNKSNEIALLRLDGDWYDSTMVCLKYLYPKVVNGGMIILDDYYTWDGCSRAVHDYLSQIQSASRIFTSEKIVCYIIKSD